MSIVPLPPQPSVCGSSKSVQNAVARLRRTWAPVDRFVQRHNALVAVALVAAFVHAAQAIAWPLDDSERRDSADYFLTFLELGQGDPLFPEQALARPPVAPLVLGGSMELGGPVLLEAMMCVAFVTTITAYFAAARHFGSLLAVAVAMLLLLSFDVGALYHQVSSDALFSTGLAVLALTLARAWISPTRRAFSVAGLVAALCVLTRPSGLVMLPVVATCILLVRGSARQRLGCAFAFVLMAGLLLASHATVNAIRYDQFAVSSLVFPPPLYGLFVYQHLVSPDNGPASRDLGRAIEDLVATEPYRSYGITSDRVFSEGTNYMTWDIVWLANQRWGDQASAHLRDVLWETVRAHPRDVAGSALDTLLYYLRAGYSYEAPTTQERGIGKLTGELVVINGRILPKANEGQLIPHPHTVNGWASDPAGGYVYDWRDVWRPELRFTDPAKDARYAEHQRRLSEHDDALPARNGSRWLATRLNAGINAMPATLFWLVLGFVALVVRRPYRASYFVTLLLAGLSVDALHAVSMPQIGEYGLPSAPLLLVFSLGALLARRRNADVDIA